MSAEAQPSTQPPAASAGGSSGGLAGYFKFEERGTNAAIEAKAGLTTFFVMVYIIFLNAAILGAGFKLDPAGIAAVSAGTALIAGIATIVMGIVGNYPLALAAGLGINGIVAFSLTGRGLTPVSVWLIDGAPQALAFSLHLAAPGGLPLVGKGFISERPTLLACHGRLVPARHRR